MRPLLATVVTGPSLLAAAPVQAARTWDPPRELRSAGGEPIQTPTLAFTSTGELLTTWSPDYQLPDGSDPGMRFAARPPSGAFGPASTLDEQPHLAIFEPDRSGGAFLAWVRDGQQLAVAYRPRGGPVQPRTELGRGNVGLELATNARGDAAVVYNRYGYEDFGAPRDERRLYTSFRAAGGGFAAPEPLSAPIPDAVNNYGLDVALMPDGRALYVWEEVEGQSSVVKSAVRRPSGEVEGPVTLSRLGRRSYGPRVATDAAGNAFAVWLEAPGPSGSGGLMTSHRPATGSFGAARDLGGSTDFRGAELGVSDVGEAIVSYQSSTPLPGGQGSQLGPAEVVIGSTRTGAFGRPTPLRSTVSFGSKLAMNARGDALVFFQDFMGGDLRVARRAPFEPFQQQDVRCAPPATSPDAAALAPDGAAVLLSHVDYRPTEISEDRETTATPFGCGRPAQPFSRPAHFSRSARFSFGVRLAGRRRLRRGRSVALRLKCSQACVVRARGSMKLPRRRRRVPFKSARLVFRAAGTQTLRVALTRRGAKQLSRSSRQGRARAAIRVTARSASGQVRTVALRQIRP